MALNVKAAYACAYKMLDEIATSEAKVSEIHVHGCDAWFTKKNHDKNRTNWMPKSLPWWTGEAEARILTKTIENVARKHGYEHARITTTDFSDTSIDEYGRHTFTIALA